MHRLKGQDVPSGGRLAGEQPGRSRGAVLSRSGRSTEITRRPLPPLGADFFARATSRQSTSKLSMIDGVEPATKGLAKLCQLLALSLWHLIAQGLSKSSSKEQISARASRSGLVSATLWPVKG